MSNLFSVQENVYNLANKNSEHELIIKNLLRKYPCLKRKRFLNNIKNYLSNIEGVATTKNDFDFNGNYSDCKELYENFAVYKKEVIKEYNEIFSEISLVPDLFYIDDKNSQILVFEVEIENHINVNKKLEFLHLKFILDDVYDIDFHLYTIDRYESVSEIDLNDKYGKFIDYFYRPCMKGVPNFSKIEFNEMLKFKSKLTMNINDLEKYLINN